MPFPLDYFNNELDPTLTSEVKPFLYFFDEYQTYDLVVFSPIRRQLATFIQKYFGQENLPTNVNCFSSICLTDKVLIERFTPFEYDWCDNYSELLKNNFHYFSATGINNNEYNGATDSWFTSENHPNIDFGNQDTEPEYNENWEQLELTIPVTEESQLITITWLSLCDYGYDFSGNVSSYNKSYKKIVTKGSGYTIKVKLNYIQPCSLRITCTDSAVYDSIYEQIPLVFRYGYFDFVFNQLKAAIDYSFPYLNYYLGSFSITMQENPEMISVRVYELYKQNYNYTVSYYGGDLDGQVFVNNYTQDVMQNHGINAYSNDASLSTNYNVIAVIDPIEDLQEIPETAKKSTIVYANNNYWRNGITEIDQNVNDCKVYNNNPLRFSLLNYKPSVQYYPIIWKTVNGNYNSYLIQRKYDYLGDITNPIQPLTDEQIITVSDDNYYPDEIYTIGERTMPDSIRVKETHEFIRLLFNPDKHAYDKNGDEATFTLGDQIDLIANVLGVSFYRDGSIKSIRKRKNLKSGTAIPNGYGSGQFEIHAVGENSNYQDGGINGEERIGIQYDNISNNLISNVFDPNSYDIENGDYVLCENWLQYFQAFKDDIDKALALQEMSAGILPSEDGTKLCSFEGMGILIAEVAYMLSKMSRDTSQNLISSLITQATNYELLKSTGQPLTAKSFKVKTGSNTSSKIVFPAIASTAPNSLQQFMLLLENLAPVIAYVTDIVEGDLAQITNQ